MIPYLPLFESVPDADPNGVLIDALTNNPGEITVTLDAIPSRDPDDAVVFEADLVDVNGLPITSLDLTDMLRITVAAQNGSPVPDVAIWAGLSAGPVGTSRGMAVGLSDAVTGWKVQHAVATVATWAPTGASVVSSTTRAAGLQVAFGVSPTQGRVGGYALESDPLDVAHLRPITKANTGTALASSNVGNGFDRMFVAIGRIDGTGAPVTLTVGVSAVLLRMTDYDGLDAIAVHDPGPEPPTAFPSVVLVTGQSNANGTTLGPSSGTALPVGLTYLHNGVTETAWPAGTLPACGILPSLGAGLLTDTPDVTLYRRAGNGQNADIMLSTQLTGSRTDFRTSGDHADLVVIVHGEADSKILVQANAYEAKLEQWVQALEGDHPWAIVEIVELRSTTFGPHWATIRAAQVAVAGRRANRRLISTTEPTALPLVDNTHFTSDAGGGYDQLAARCLDGY